VIPSLGSDPVSVSTPSLAAAAARDLRKNLEQVNTKLVQIPVVCKYEIFLCGKWTFIYVSWRFLLKAASRVTCDHCADAQNLWTEWLDR
jgi:hypothetical protein